MGEYYIQRFETELALHGLLEGNEKANVRRNLLLSKIGPDAFRVVVDHYRPEDVVTKSSLPFVSERTGRQLHSSLVRCGQ